MIIDPSSAPAYYSLRNTFSYLHTLFGMRHVLSYDYATTMPDRAAQKHQKAVAVLHGHVYTSMAEEKNFELLKKAEHEVRAAGGNAGADLANIKRMHYIRNHLAAVPRDIYRQHVEISIIHRQKLREARESQDWDAIKPYLQNVLALYQHIARLKQVRFDVPTPYGALVSGYADGMTEEDANALFEGMAGPLSDLRDKAVAVTQDNPAQTAKAVPHLPEEAAMTLARTLLERLDFDFSRGCLNISRHGPMALGTAEDMRVLVRARGGAGLFDILTDAMYQGGRAIYEQNLPEDWRDQPLGQAPGTVMTSAVSLLLETIIGRSRAFLTYIASLVPEADARTLYLARNIVKPGLMRNGADEIHKFYHDLLRFRLERGLHNGDISFDALPGRWAEESQELIGAAPEDLASGVLQNPDWFSGRYGFIPSSILSQLLAAQLFEAIEKEHPNILARIEKGDFSLLTEWLTDNLFCYGCATDWQETMRRATGIAPLSAEPFLRHVERRYCAQDY
jgi:carboxypeptidase Taq